MQDFLSFIQEYAQIINIALFGSILGYLIRISQLSRTALIDQHNAELATKEQEINALDNKLELKEQKYQNQVAQVKLKEQEYQNQITQLELKEQQYQNQIIQIERHRNFFERLATMPSDKQLDALKLEYQMRLEELEKREGFAEQEATKKIIKEEKANLQKTKSFMEKLIKTASPEIVAQVAKVALNMYL